MDKADLLTAIRCKNMAYEHLVRADNEIHKRLVSVGSVPDPWLEKRERIAQEYRSWVELLRAHQATRRAEFDLWVESVLHSGPRGPDALETVNLTLSPGRNQSEGNRVRFGCIP